MNYHQVFWNLELNIKSDKLAALKTLANEMSLATQTNEPNTLEYEWSIDPDGTSCHIFERYTDSDAVRVHLNNFQVFADRFFDCLDVARFQVYGSPDQELQAALGELGAQFFHRINGFTR